MEQTPCSDCQQVLVDMKALRDEVGALRGLLTQEIARRRFSWRRLARRLFIAYAIVMLCVLSVGPAIRLAGKSETAEAVIEWLYTPLELLCVCVPPLEAPLSAYLSLWGPGQPQEGVANPPAF
jgi:hypothetical protein